MQAVAEQAGLELHWPQSAVLSTDCVGDLLAGTVVDGKITYKLSVIANKYRSKSLGNGVIRVYRI